MEVGFLNCNVCVHFLSRRSQIPPPLRATESKPAQQCGGTIQAPSGMESGWIQIPSGQVLNPMNSYYYNHQHVDNGRGTVGNHCGYNGQPQLALHSSGSVYAGQCPLRTGSFANESHWNAQAPVGQAPTICLPLDSTSAQRSYKLNSGPMDLPESKEQSVRNARCVAQRGQTVMNRNQLQNGTLIPTTHYGQVSDMIEENQPYFSSLTATSVSQGPMNNCFNSSNLQRMVDSEHVMTVNSSFGQLLHPVERNSTHHYPQWQNPTGGSVANGRYDTVGNWQRRMNSTNAADSAPRPFQVRQVAAPSTRPSVARVGQGSKGSQQVTFCSQNSRDSRQGTMNIVLCPDRSVAPPSALYRNSNPDVSGVSFSQNRQAVNTSYSAVPGGSNSLRDMLQTIHSMDGNSRKESIIQSGSNETNQRRYVAREVSLSGSNPSLHSVKGNGGSKSLGASNTSHRRSLPVQVEGGHPPSNLLINANGSVMTCESGFVQQHRDFAGRSCPQPPVPQQPLRPQPTKCPGTAQPSLSQTNLGPLGSVSHTADQPTSSADETQHSRHPHAVNVRGGQQPFTDQVIQLRSGLAAKNVTFVDSQPPLFHLAVQESTQVVSGQAAKGDCERTFRELHRKNDYNDPKAPVLAADAPAKADTVKLPKANNQPSLPAGTGMQKAVAVVPPISQQSNGVDQANCTAIAEHSLGCKIQCVRTLSSYSDANKDANQVNNLWVFQSEKNGEAVVSLSNEISCRGNASHNPVSTFRAEEVLDEVSCQQRPESATQGILNSERGKIPSLELDLSEFETEGSTYRPKDDQKVDLQENPFSLSAVPVTEWKTDMLRQLIAALEVSEKLTECKKSVVSCIIELFWGGKISNCANALHLGLYKNISDIWKVSPEDESTVVLTELHYACMENVAKKCLILEHGTCYPKEPAYKSSWLNLNEQLDDIDKEHGFPMSLRFGAQMAGRENERLEMNGSAERKVVEPVVKQTDRDVKQTLSQVPPVEAPDPLSSIEIKVLPPEDAKKYFESTVGENGQMEKFGNKETDQGSRKEDYQKDNFCCISQLIENLNGQEKNSLCKCQNRINLTEPMETTASDILVKKVLEVAVESPLELSSGDAVFTTEQENQELRAMTKECSVGTEADQQAEHTKSASDLATLAAGVTDKSGLNIVEIKVEDVGLGSKEVLVLDASPSLKGEETHSPTCGELRSPVSTSVNKSHDSGKSEEMETDAAANSRLSDVGDVRKCSGGTVSLSRRHKLYNSLSCKLRHSEKIKQKVVECSEKQKRTLQSKVPVEDLLLRRTEGEEEKVSTRPQAVPRVKDHRNSHSVAKVQHKPKHKRLDSQVTSDVPKPSVNNCGKEAHKTKGVAKDKLEKETSREATAESEGSTTVNLTLYGSSPRLDQKIGLPDKPSPPTTISLNITSHNRNTLEKNPSAKNSQAKQRVYSSWQSSLIPETTRSKTKGKARTGKKGERQTERPIVSPSRRNDDSSLRLHSPLKHPDVSTSGAEKQKGANNLHVPNLKTDNAVPRKNGAALTGDHVMLQSSVKEKPKPPLRLKRKLFLKGNNAHVSKRPCLQAPGKGGSEGRSKHKIGNPALMQLPVKDNVLEFKLLPESFAFSEAEGCADERPLKLSKKTAGPQKPDESTRKMKVATWKAKSLWCRSLQKEEPVSDQLAMPANSTYEKYRRRYFAKAKREESSLNTTPKDSKPR
ncbi:uncharacterized protein LOC108920777 [Arapaima gigas]